MSSVVRPMRDRAVGPARLLGIAVASALVLAAVPAVSQETDLKPLLDRLQRLERDIQTMNVQLSRGGTAPAPLSSDAPQSAVAGGEDGSAVARLGLRMTALENEARAATGRAEEISHQIDQVNRRLDKLIGDVDFRLSQLEKGLAEMRGQEPDTARRQATDVGTAAAGAPALRPETVARSDTSGPAFATPPGVLGTLPREEAERIGREGGAAAPAAADGATGQPARSAAATPTGLPEGSPRERYDHAFGLLRQTRYDEAEAALRAFLDAHPADPLAGNARYWLGETFYVRADYVKAAEVFLDGYQQDPKGSKAADTLLKLGMSLAHLDKKREACAAFDKLTREFPDAPGNIRQVVGRERQRNACN